MLGDEAFGEVFCLISRLVEQGFDGKSLSFAPQLFR